MIVQPKTKGFICITAHPTGCARNIQEQIDYVLKRGPVKGGPKKALIIGESTGARLPDAMGARGMGMLLGNDNTQFRRTRETPMVAAAFGPSFGSSTWMMCISDFAVMHKGATVAVSSPGLVLASALRRVG